MRFLTVLSLLAIVGFCSAATTYNINFAAQSCTAGSGTCPGIGFQFAFSSGPWPAASGTLVQPVINLSVGDMLVFTRTATQGSHPFVICSGSDNTNQCYHSTQGVGMNLTMPITNQNQMVTWTAANAGTYWYGCINHMGMGAQINVVTTGTDNTQETICTYYTRALNAGSADANQQTSTIDAIVTRAVLGNSTVTQPAVQGIVAATAPTKKYFDGSIACIFTGGSTPGTTNFLANGGNNVDFQALEAKLVAFFGTALGCNAPGFVSASAAGNRGSMWQVHQFMMITDSEMQYFITQVVDSVKSYTNNGALLRTGDATTLVNFLNGFNHGATAAAVNGMGLTPGSFNNGATEQICNDATCRNAPSAQGGYASAASTPMFLVTIMLILAAMIRF